MVLTPAEALGLSGASLDGRVRRALHHVADSTLARIASRLAADATENAVVYEHAGVIEPVRIMLRPLLIMPDQLAYVHRVCTTLTDALKRLPELYLRDPQLQRVLAVRPDEDAWLRELWTPRHSQLNTVYGRLDAVCDFTSADWHAALQFMEPNLSGVGGIHFAPLAEALVMRDVVPTLMQHDPQLAIELPRDQRDLFLQVLLDHARLVGRAGSVIALIEPKYEHDGPNEQPVLRRYLHDRHGISIVHADPRELRVVGHEVFYEDACIDVAYRDYESRDLLTLERSEGKPLSGMRLLFQQNRVVSSLVGDFDHKSCWELFTDDALAERYFSVEQRRVFRKHVLWTRLVSERRTGLPHAEGDLLPFIRDHREELVLKPNRGYGGAGVCIGAAVTRGEWEQLLERAVAKASDSEEAWVVQVATRLPVYEFPLVDATGRVHEEPFYAVMGFAATDDGLGILCRVSQKQVVSVAQRGGLAAVLVGHPPRELRSPRRASVPVDDSLAALRVQIRELRHLDQTIGVLGWDEETYLPQAARAGRGDQVATLEGLRHTLLVSERLGELIEDVSGGVTQDASLRAELARLRKLRRQASALPADLVRAFAQARSTTLAAWEQARAADDYQLFAPSFTTLLSLCRERASLLAEGGDSYDALLDEYEPGMTRARMEPVLFELRDRLAGMVERFTRATEPHAQLLAGRRFPEAAQWELCRELLGCMGFSFERGRLDRSTHPFTLSAGGDDVRLTIRVFEDNLPSAIFATLHEGGHGLYDQGYLPEDHDGLLAEAPSTGLHESQSRLWENHVGRSRAFWQGFFPRLQARFASELAGLDAESFYRAVNVVRPSLNRVESDELTYNLHILLRYELEVRLFSGGLCVADLPAAWSERCQALFGLRPESAREGCLQDVHWSLGAFGYFPTYALGNLYAAQLIEHYAASHDLVAELRACELGSLRRWLRQEVHEVGHRRGAEEIITQVTGKGLDAGAFFRALERKLA
ncbi:MAG TPA: carboxypeptidase M32 [Polyangiales bacterium]